MCCTRLSGNTGRKNDAKNCHLRTIAQVCRAESLQLACIDNRKKNLLSSNISSTCPHSRLTSGWDQLGSLGHPTNFNGFRVLALLLQRCRSPEANQTLHDVWPSPGLLEYIYIYIYFFFRGLLPPDGISPHAEFSFRPSLVFSYIGSITAQHSSGRVSQTLRHGTRNGITELSQRAPPIFGWVAITLGIGPHSNLWSPYVIGRPYIYFHAVVCSSFFFLSFFFLA